MNKYFSSLSVWDSPNGPSVPLLPVSSEHNDTTITVTNTAITSNATVTAVAYMQIEPEIQTSAETISSNNTIDSKKRHHHRGKMKIEDVSFFLH